MVPGKVYIVLSDKRHCPTFLVNTRR